MDGCGVFCELMHGCGCVNLAVLSLCSVNSYESDGWMWGTSTYLYMMTYLYKSVMAYLYESVMIYADM